jgi:hypothetical protein
MFGQLSWDTILLSEPIPLATVCVDARSAKDPHRQRAGRSRLALYRRTGRGTGRPVARAAGAAR